MQTTKTASPWTPFLRLALVVCTMASIVFSGTCAQAATASAVAAPVVRYAVNVQMDMDGERSQPKLIVGEGETFSLHRTNNGNTWHGEFNVSRKGDLLVLRGTMTMNGQALPSPVITVPFGQAATLSIGGMGKKTGLDVAMTFNKPSITTVHS